jgi:hypothetical protein
LAITEGDPHIDDRREEIEEAGGYLVVCGQTGGVSTTNVIRKWLSEESKIDQYIQASSLAMATSKIKGQEQNEQNNWQQLDYISSLKE